MTSVRLLAALALAPLWGCSAPDAAAGDDDVVRLDLAPVELENLHGGTVSFADEWAAGNDVVLVFWQTWCLSCEREAESVLAAVERNPDMTFVGVVPGPDEDVDEFELMRKIEDQGLHYAQVRDRDLSLSTALDVRGTPTLIVLGPGGEVAFRGHEVPAQWLAR